MPHTDPTMMMGMMAELNRLEGVEYDIVFLESMVDHPDDVIHMSERLIKRVPEGEEHAELRAMAQPIKAPRLKRWNNSSQICPPNRTREQNM